MSGMDIIVQQIDEECEKQCNAIIEEAEKKAKDILDRAEKQVSENMAEADRKNEILKKNKELTSKTSSDLKKRQAILSAKQEMINTVLKKAEEKILGQDDQSYFKFILQILEKNAQAKEGEIFFNDRDLKRLPNAFYKDIDSVVSKKNGSLKISSESKDIDGGFVLVYGGVEENCSISAIFRNEHEKLVDLVNSNLFK